MGTMNGRSSNTKFPCEDDVIYGHVGASLVQPPIIILKIFFTFSTVGERLEREDRKRGRKRERSKSRIAKPRRER